jgi:hypothetical protein
MRISKNAFAFVYKMVRIGENMLGITFQNDTTRATQEQHKSNNSKE